MKSNYVFIKKLKKQDCQRLFRLILLLLYISNINNIITAQDTTEIPFVNKNTNKEILEITKAIIGLGWIEFKEEKKINPYTIFQSYKSAFGLSQNDDMELFKIKEDKLGFTHYHYQQLYKGIKVKGGEYIVHSRNGITLRANGKIVENLSIDIIPSIDKKTALNFILNKINAVQYMWDNNLEEKNLKKNKNDNNATNYPNTELVIICISDNFNISPKYFRLVYKFNINVKNPYNSYWVYVNAHSGEVLKQVSSILYDCSTGTCATSYYGTRSFTTKHRGFPNYDYILRDECRGDGIHTFINGNNVDDVDNQWSLPEERPATTTHWAMQMTFDYFLNSHGRSSFNGNDKEIKCDTKVQVNGSDFNAGFVYDDEYFKFGQANGDDGYNSLDVVGHEFTHGVNKFEANLDVTGESSALSESFGDIFGEMVEFYTLGNNNFIHASEI